MVLGFLSDRGGYTPGFKSQLPYFGAVRPKADDLNPWGFVPCLENGVTAALPAVCAGWCAGKCTALGRDAGSCAAGIPGGWARHLVTSRQGQGT